MILPPVVAPPLPPARYLVFLVRDDGPRPKDSKDLEAMQAAHLGNFKRRYDEGKLVAAGPVSDPTQHRRGIVILSVKTRQEVLACFDDDPYIKNRLMRVEVHRWAVPPTGFRTGQSGKMAEYRLVRLSLPDGVASPSLLGGVGGRFVGEPISVILVPSTDDAGLRRTLDASPAVRAGGTYDIVPLYLQAGTLG